LSQTFFVGNGLSPAANPAGSVLKVFVVPEGATRLCLGISDGCYLADGPPGCYQDNVGTFMASVTLFPAGK
jgi:hypothetical protein